MFDQSTDLVRAAAQATDNRRLLAAVAALYRQVDIEVARHDAVCAQCGGCCRFERHGHNLFVSTAEFAFFLHRTNLSRVTGPIAGQCPFLREGPSRCAARSARLLGCRLYHCRPDAQWWQYHLYDRMHARLRELHVRYEVPYFYAEWMRVLRAGAEVRCKPCGRKGPTVRTNSSRQVDRNFLPPYALNVRPSKWPA